MDSRNERNLDLLQEEQRDGLEACEKFALEHEWPHEYGEEGELAVGVAGEHCEYSLVFMWDQDHRTLYFSCTFSDLKVECRHASRMNALVVLLNRSLQGGGHFDYIEEGGVVFYRDSFPTRGTPGPSKEQVEDFVELALRACERSYPAFQYLIWGGKTPKEAVELSMFETVGEA